jgi:hypothetical protein
MFTTLLQSARRCNAVYIEDFDQMATAFNDLNHLIIGTYINDDHKAVLSLDASSPTASTDPTYLTISGTRFTSGTPIERFGDLYDDIDTTPLEIEPGIVVPTGPWQGCKELFEWAAETSKGAKLFIEGHSLGSRSRYARYFIPSDRIAQIVAFAPPKFASLAFWSKYWHPGDITCIYWRDLWAGWPWDLIGETPWRQPPGQSILYLEPRNFAYISEKDWKGGLLPEDHSISGVYIPALEHLSSVFENGDGA